jgi:N-methylhydantoinase B
MSDTREAVDAVTVEIVRNALLACAEEMKIDLRRTSYNPIVNEGNDFSVGIFSPSGETVAQAPGLPEFVCDIPSAIASVAEDIGGFTQFEDGDLYLTNDPYANTFHVHDVNSIRPFFIEETLAGFACARAHWHDIGGASAAGNLTAVEVFQEGIILRSVDLYRRGRPNRAVFRIIESNTRLPETVLGDVRAQVGACHVGAQRVLELIGRYGLDVYEECVQRILADGERQALEALRKIPDGTYIAESGIDDDGVTRGVPLPIKATVRKGRDRLTIDLTGSAEAVRGCVNCNRSTTHSICRLVFKTLTTPSEPANEGHFRMVDLIVPENSIFNAQRPSATLPGFFALHALEDVVKRALANAVPDQVNAEEYGCCCPAHIKFRDPDGSYRILADTEGGGWGGTPSHDGESAMLFGEVRVIPIEIMEMRYPVLLRQYRLRENTGGPGRFRGGLGVIKQYECLADCELNAGFDRKVFPPAGILGGKGSVGNQVVIIDHEGRRTVLPSKITDYSVRKGEIISFETAGGGGYGNPLDRDLIHIDADVKGGYVTSREQLQEDYGIVFSDGARDIDVPATADKRDRLLAARSQEI